jgi:hypothetical protein
VDDAHSRGPLCATILRMRAEDWADHWLPRHPRLRPGLRAVRRDGGHLQVGIDPGDRVVLPDDEPARRLLADLQAGRRPALDEAGGWCRELVERGFVVDADALDQALHGPVPRESVLSAFASAGPSAAARLAARGSARVAVDATERWRTVTLRAMTAAGLTVAAPGDRRVAHLLVDPGDELLDELVRRSEPHLVVTGVAGRITVGPFVSPGLTACSRCVTAHRCDRDPGHATVLEQYATGPDARVPPDPVLLQLAAAWAVRDLVSYVEGDVPATWSSTVPVDPALTLVRQHWLRHAGCGCHWGDELAAG